jgi:uncharacterized membrane protein
VPATIQCYREREDGSPWFELATTWGKKREFQSQFAEEMEVLKSPNMCNAAKTAEYALQNTDHTLAGNDMNTLKIGS